MKSMNRVYAAAVLALVVISSSGANVVLTLAEAEGATVENSFTARKQQYQSKAVEWGRRGSIAAYLPSVDYNFTYLRMDESTVGRANAAFDGIESLFESLGPLLGAAPGDGFSENPNRLFENSFSHEVALSQPLFNGGIEIVSSRLANVNRRAVHYQQRSDLQRAVLETRRAYLDAVTASQMVALSEESLGWTRKNLNNVSIRFENGGVPETDLLQWKIELATRKNDLKMAQTAKQSLLLSLYHSMGYNSRKANGDVMLLDMDYFENLHRQNPAKSATDYNVNNNPALLMMSAYSEVAQESRGVARAQYLPKVNAFFSYKWDAWDRLRPHETNRGWSAGAVATVPLFSGFRSTTNYQKTKYEHLETVVSTDELKNQLENSLKTVLWHYEALQFRMATSNKKIELMERQLELMQKRYDGGLVNQSQLLEVELGLRQAQIAYTQELMSSIITKAEIELITGNLENMQ